MRLVSPDQMRELDRRTIAELGLPAVVLMETAGRAIARAVLQRLGPPDGRLATVLAGAGNNGGDGFVAARVLHAAGFDVDVYGAGDPGRMSPETQVHYKAMRHHGLDCRWYRDVPKHPELQNLRRSLGRSAAIVDALAGIGPVDELHEPLRTFAAQLDGRHRALVVAADVPSGLCAVDGRVLGAAVRCDVVVTMGAAKAGLFLGNGPDLWDEIEVADIGIPPGWVTALEPVGRVIDAAAVRALLPLRPAVAHKGTCGHAFVVAGSPGKAGAALLASHAALRAGAGLVTLGTSGEVRGRLEAEVWDLLVEAVRGGASEAKRIEKLVQKKSALCVGPGLGTGAAEADLVQRLVAVTTVPVLLDADALHLLAQKPDVGEPARGRLVLTPHPGEMAALLATTVDAVEADRAKAAHAAAARFGAVVVLKGARTLIAAPDGAWAVWPRPNAALAKGGTGDVLAGLIGGLLAQGATPFAAACAGVGLHGLAGQKLRGHAGARGGTASDLLAQVVAVLAEIDGGEPVSGDGRASRSPG
ncbi:MAG: NAD(P)H-hydrate dehydratase [Myxococcales bacterium]|nr:NAD(P)H-hydrate dehydratase [Myxococcales bacterium]